MIYFNLEQVEEIHISLMSKTGGIAGVRDKNLLDFSLKSPFQTFDGNELYPDVFDKVAQLCYSLINNHPFVDGNKRMGIHLSLLFLKLNGQTLLFSQKELVECGLNIASGKMNKNAIKELFLGHNK